MEVELVALQGGAFRMGRARAGPDEPPVPLVDVARFRIAPRPVSNMEYAQFVAATGAPAPPFLSDRRFAEPRAPVVGVSWFDAVAYCAWLTNEAGVPARLPSESEREFAARGGLEDGDWPWGNAPPHEREEFEPISRLEYPHVPDDACANAFGLFCMAENVHEWCSDWSIEGSRRASRGGSWRHAVKFTQVWARSSLDPSFRYADYGFRVAADGPE